MVLVFDLVVAALIAAQSILHSLQAHKKRVLSACCNVEPIVCHLQLSCKYIGPLSLQCIVTILLLVGFLEVRQAVNSNQPGSRLASGTF